MNNEQTMKYFAEYLRKENKSEQTIKNYLSDLNTFAEFLGAARGDGVSDAAKNDIIKFITYLEKSGQAKSTVNRRLQSLRTLFNAMQADGIRNDFPIEGIKPKKIAHQNETKWLDKRQVKAIFEAIDNTKHGDGKKALHRAIISVMVNCGLRVQELVNLRMDDLDFEHGFISVEGKGGKFRKVPFNPATQKAVLRWFKYRDKEGDFVFQSERSPQMTTRAVQHIAKKLSEDLPFEFSVHQLRHTALKHLADTTGKIEIVANVAGHEHIQTSRRYIEPSLQEIADAMKNNEFDF